MPWTLLRALRPVRTSGSVLLASLLLLAASPGGARAEDTDQIRFYGGYRLGPVYRLHPEQGHGLRIDRFSMGYGFSLGVNLGRHVGIELAGDMSQTDLALDGRRIGEYGTFSLVPTLRLRYPLLGGALTPYVLGGIGFGNNQFNDRKAPGAGLSIRGNDTAVLGAVGAGLEYFVANNVSVGLDGKYVISRNNTIEIEGRRQKLNLDRLMLQGRFSVFFPETPAVQASPPHYGTDGRFYIGFRHGVSVTPDGHLGGDFEYAPSADGAFGAWADQQFGFSFGWDIGRFLGVELAGGGYSPNLALSGVGLVAEYAVYYIIPQLRVRYPILGGRLVPYVKGGVGVTYLEVKDVKPRGFGRQLQGTSFAVAGMFGAGVDYMVARNVAVGVESEYLHSGTHSISMDGRTQGVQVNAILTSLGIRVYFGQTGSPL